MKIIINQYHPSGLGKGGEGLTALILSTSVEAGILNTFSISSVILYAKTPWTLDISVSSFSRDSQMGAKPLAKEDTR
jgi:hypothetical protein